MLVSPCEGCPHYEGQNGGTHCPGCPHYEGLTSGTPLVEKPLTKPGSWGWCPADMSPEICGKEECEAAEAIICHQRAKAQNVIQDTWPVLLTCKSLEQDVINIQLRTNAEAEAWGRIKYLIRHNLIKVIERTHFDELKARPSLHASFLRRLYYLVFKR
jgi:hypothetical protein